MTDDNNPISGITAPKPKVEPTKVGEESTVVQNTGEAPKGELGQQEFLMLLVEQLQHQDPLDPMSNEEFAVQLAQFSQLDELIAIKDAVTGDAGSVDSSSPISSMASYLGHEVVLGGDQQATNNSNLLFNVPSGTQSVRIDLTDENGNLAGQFTIEDAEAGRQVVPLSQYNLADGKYDARVVSVDSDGQFVELDTKATGTVEGFVLEPAPALLINGEEVSLEEIVEVYQGAS